MASVLDQSASDHWNCFEKEKEKKKLVCNDDATLHSRYITLQRGSNVAFALYVFAMTKQHCIRVKFRCNDKTMLHSR